MIHIALWLSMVCAARFVLYFCVLILSPKQNIVLLMYRKTIVYVTAPFFLYAPGGGDYFAFCLSTTTRIPTIVVSMKIGTVPLLPFLCLTEETRESK